MTFLYRTAGIAAAALVLAGAATPALAGISRIDFHVPQTSLDVPPAMEMTHDGKDWKWANANDSFNIRLKVLFQSVGNRFSLAVVEVERTTHAIWRMPEHKTYKYEKLEQLTIGRAILSPFQNDAKALCGVFGGEKKTIRDMDVSLLGWASLNGDVTRKKGVLPVKVVCMPKKAAPPPRVPVALKVEDVKLYTSPAKPVCGKPVRLVAEFHTNQPGKVSFVLQRRDGEEQGASVTTTDTAGGPAKRWWKEYLYNSTITREYKIVVPGHPVATGWVPVTVNCDAAKRVKRPGAFAG